MTCLYVGRIIFVRKAIGTVEFKLLQSLLRTCRHEAGLTQQEVAARLNTTPSRVSEYETGERRADLIQLLDLCQVYEISLVDLVSRFVEAVEKAREDSAESDEVNGGQVRRRTIARRPSL